MNLYPGNYRDAQKSGAKLLEPTKDTVTYSDAKQLEEVLWIRYSVEATDQEFDLAIIGTKGVWYDHKVSAWSDPVAGVRDEEEKVTELRSYACCSDLFLTACQAPHEKTGGRNQAGSRNT